MKKLTNNIVVGLDLAEKMGLCVINGATKQLLFSSHPSGSTCGNNVFSTSAMDGSSTRNSN